MLLQIHFLSANSNFFYIRCTGILQFNAEVSSLADIKAYSHNDLIRVLERSIKESESIDTESLCIISGEKVVMILSPLFLYHNSINYNH